MPGGVSLNRGLIPMLKIEKARSGNVILHRRGKPYASRNKYNKIGRLMQQGVGK
jgi:hypothetical protein